MSGAPYAFPWEQAAMGGEEMPGGLSLADQAAYTALRNVYAAYHRKQIDRETAAAEKREIRRAYEQAVGLDASRKRLSAFEVRRIRATELYITAVRKDPTPENALRLCDILDGLERPGVEVEVI